MILKIQYFAQLPPHVARRICQCGGFSVFSYKPKSYDHESFTCKSCGKDQIRYWWLCSSCSTYFHRNPNTFQHPGWSPLQPKCYPCLEESPDYVWDGYPSSVRNRFVELAIRRGKVPPKGYTPKKRKSLEEVLAFDPFEYKGPFS